MAKTVTSSKSSVVTQDQNKEFNVWEYTYKQLVKGFLENGEKPSFDCTVCRMDDYSFEDKKTKEKINLQGSRKVFGYLHNKTGLDVLEVKEINQDNGKRVYVVKIDNFNIKAEVEGKFGKRKIFAKHYGNLKLA